MTPRRLHGEHGASLVLALMFLAVFGVLSVALLGFGDASVRADAGYRTQRARNLATDAALDGAINRVEQGPVDRSRPGDLHRRHLQPGEQPGPLLPARDRRDARRCR